MEDGAPRGQRASHLQRLLKDNDEIHVGDLGSGSDFTPFLQHVGVPSTDIGSSGPYGVYHSTFDNYAWFTANADPHFAYLQEMARVWPRGNPHGGHRCAALRLRELRHAIASYIEVAKRKAADTGEGTLDFAPAEAAVEAF